MVMSCLHLWSLPSGMSVASVLLMPSDTAFPEHYLCIAVVMDPVNSLLCTAFLLGSCRLPLRYMIVLLPACVKHCNSFRPLGAIRTPCRLEGRRLEVLSARAAGIRCIENPCCSLIACTSYLISLFMTVRISISQTTASSLSCES